MAVQLLSVAATAAVSADVVVTDTPVTFSLFGAAPPLLPNGVVVLIQIKDAATNYTTIGQINDEVPAVVAAGPATYRLSRPTQRNSVGAFSG